MAETPNDPRWPPGSEIDFDTVLDRLLEIKRHHWPQHTARDGADPVIQILRLIAALGQHALGRLNHALLQLSPKTATSHRALLSILEIVNRPLLPPYPARGFAYAKLKSAPTIDTVVIPRGTRIAIINATDPSYTADEDISTGSSVAFSPWFFNEGTGVTTAFVFGSSFVVDVGDAFILGFDALPYDAVDLAFGTPFTNGTLDLSYEHFNEEWVEIDGVTDLGVTLRIEVATFVRSDVLALDALIGLEVTVRHKATGIEETVQTTNSGGEIVAVTSHLGQATPSLATGDYEVTGEWRPMLVSDGTSAWSVDGAVAWNIEDVFSEGVLWATHPVYGYAIRIRVAADPGAILSASLELNSCVNTTGDFFAVADFTQGYRQTVTVGTTDGTAFQHMAVSNEPIQEPVYDPTITLDVGGDADWSVVADFSDSGTTSRHAIFREDVDDSWGVIFGDGVIGELPADGSAVKVTYRTGSIQPGDIEPGTSIRALSNVSTVDSWVTPRGMGGYLAAEATDLETVQRFRHQVLPQLALRAESVVTSDEVTTALSGGAPNRASFTTEDDRTPFTRALYSTTSVGARQYRVLVVGSESDDDGAVDPADTDEAEEWLNGVEIGVQKIGGHGPNNTDAIVSSFVAVQMLPTVTITIADQQGVRDIADQIIRAFFRPHSRDDDGAFRWEFGGRVPVAILFGLLWDALPGRYTIAISVDSDAVTYNLDGIIELDEFELPILHIAYDPLVYIVLADPP